MSPAWLVRPMPLAKLHLKGKATYTNSVTHNTKREPLKTSFMISKIRSEFKIF